MSHVPWPGTAVILPQVLKWASTQRWFPLKNAALPKLADIRVALDLPLAVNIHALVLELPRPATSPLWLHIPLVAITAAQMRQLKASPTGANGFLLPNTQVALLDATSYPEFWRIWAQTVIDAQTALNADAVKTIAQRAHELLPIAGEQSNTSIIFPAVTNRNSTSTAADENTESIIVKLFRVLECGNNPEVELSIALARNGWDHIPAPLAWSTLTFTTAERQCVSAHGAIATRFISKVTDGFKLFCQLAADAQNTHCSARARAIQLAQNLGATTAQMHQHLATALGVFEPATLSAFSAQLQNTATWARQEVPQIEQQIPALTAAIAQTCADLATVKQLPPATRIHGDYHLGQTLYQSSEERWFVLDFEGEPLRPLSQRCHPDQPLRDVASMLRSFAYAAATAKITDSQWLPQIRQAFLSGYSSNSLQAVTGSSRKILRALELEKALYEAVYEARQRPDWLPIPLRAIAELTKI